MNFNFGKKTKNIYTYAFIGVLFTMIVTLVSQCTGIPENKIYDAVDEIQRNIPSKPLNDFIINDPVLLNRRVTRDVDEAIRQYEELVQDKESRLSPSFSSEKAPDGSKAQELLGGELRICAPWVSDCPKFEYN
jgi:hypothetical protein